MTPRITRAYTGLTCGLALALSLLLFRASAPSLWLPVLALVMLTVVTENFAFELPIVGSVSLSFAAIFAALLYSGPFAAILCALAASSNLEDFRSKKPLTFRVFNAGQLALSAGLAGLVYFGLGGRSLVAEPDSGIHLLAATSAALTIYISNVLLVGLFVSTLQHSKLSAVLREQGFLSYGFSMMVLALLGVMVAQLLALGSWWGLLLLIMPFLAARRTFRVYAELTEAYTSTVRSLVTAIEAKDPYTRGHSERVAVYARRLAERMAFSRADLDLLERAALLHDVGKIGIELDTLTSPAQLSAEEVRAIRQHPVIGSELVGDVEFLSDVVPIVRHHHERFDGAGYPDGLVGESIPLLARVLAVADSYDAMTSDRAYRPGMSQEQALVEIARVAGKQLDRDMARQFSALIADGPVEGIG